jgi:Gnt-I system high-affinity gluconate transporter
MIANYKNRNQRMSFIIVLLCIALLILLITWGRVNSFIAFLIVSLLAGVFLGLPLNKVVASVQQGIGNILGSLVIIISLGAMLGKIVAESGAAEKISAVLMNIFGVKYLQWALMVTGFIIGIPLFYGVGFVLMVPLIFSLVYKYKLPAVYTGLPMLAAMSVTHGFLPPHPSPTALVLQLHANMGITLLYGLMVAIPAIILAGPVFSKFIKHIPSHPLETFMPKHPAERSLPGTSNSFITSLLPVGLLILTAAVIHLAGGTGSFKAVISFVGDPAIVMLVSVCVAAFTLGIAQKRTMKEVMVMYSDAVKDVAMILLIIAGAGALMQVITDSGVSKQIGQLLQTLPVNPLLLGWLIAAIIRLCVGSATIAGLTTAGIIAPLVIKANVNPNLMVLAVGAGSLMFSHVNDAAFWMFKEYFNLSIKDTLKTWSVMETIVSVAGLAGVLLLSYCI